MIKTFVKDPRGGNCILVFHITNNFTLTLLEKRKQQDLHRCWENVPQSFLVAHAVIGHDLWEASLSLASYLTTADSSTPGKSIIEPQATLQCVAKAVDAAR